MRQIILISRIFIFGVIVHLLTLNVWSQNDSLSSLSGTDSLKYATTVARHSLYTGLGYGSNMLYLGSTISQNQPYGYAAISYGYKEKFFATVSSVHLSGMNPFQAFNTGSLNYNHVFNSWIDISSGIYGYHVAKSLTDTLFNNFLYGDFTLGIDWKLIYSQFSAGVLLSDENISYFQVKNSRYFKTPEFFKKKFFISFNPYVNLLLGTLLKAETTTQTSISVSPVYRRRGTTSPDTTNMTNSYINYSKIFGLMEVDFGFPVAFNTDFMILEAEVNYVLPIHDDPNYPGSKGVVFLISCIFRIF